MKKCLLVIFIVIVTVLYAQNGTKEVLKNGIIDPDPNELFQTLQIDSSSIDTLFVNNIGDSLLDYTASIDYDGYASAVTVHENNFETVLGWTSTGTRPWSRQIIYDGGTLNGTPMAVVSASTSGVVYHSYLTSYVIDLSNYDDGTTISFQQKKSKSASTGAMEVSVDGTNWISLYSNTSIVGAWGEPDIQTISIPAEYRTSSTKFRFHATLPSLTGGYWALDNIVIKGAVPYSWLNFDGEMTTSGTVQAGYSDSITVGFNSVGLEAGLYTANIRLNSQFSYESVPVTLNVLTETGFPNVETVEITEIKITSAKIKGNITSLGDPLPTSYGICWNTTGNPTISDYLTDEGNASSTGEFISDMENLNKDTRYYVRAYVTNILGTDYGNLLILKTDLFYGSGTVEEPYQISSLTDLYNLSRRNEFWIYYYIQTSDINASETLSWNEGFGFSPIGDSAIPLRGSYDGQNYTIDSLFIYNPIISTSTGLFGVSDGSIIKNLSIMNADITGASYTGILCGNANNNTIIENCKTGGFVSGGGSCGGIVGYASNNNIIFNTISYSYVSGNSNTGGLVGRSVSGNTVSFSYSAGTVTGPSVIGGLVGYNSLGCKVSNSYSSASVTGGSKVGGCIGSNTSGSITNCYSYGSVTGTTETGGIVGYNESLTTVKNSFWDIETSGQTISAGGLGKTTAEMKTRSTFTDATWDFVGETVNGTDDIWNINAYYNDGYPFLSWQVFPLANPQNVITSIVEGNIKLDWDDMPDEIGYNVYSSDDPYGEFTLLTTVAVSEYTYTPVESKKFFYITGKDILKKEQPKTIEIPKKIK